MVFCLIKSLDLPKAPSYRAVAYTYENEMNRQPGLPLAPKPMTKEPSSNDLVEQPCITLDKILLWDLLWSTLVY